jgi:hypothetical protein
MAKIGFVNSQADPCMFLKFWNGMKCILALYVDDSIIAGDEKLIEDTICRLKKVFNIMVQGSLEDYLGCDIKRSDKGFCIGQKRIIEDLAGRLSQFLSGRDFTTPRPGGNRVMRPSDDSLDSLDNEEQMLYRSAVGSLLFLVKYSKPDFEKCVRINIQMKGPNMWILGITMCES